MQQKNQESACGMLLLNRLFPRSFDRSTARVISDGATPRKRAISAAGRPNSSLPRQAILPSTLLTTFLRLPLCGTFGPSPKFLHLLADDLFMTTQAENVYTSRSRQSHSADPENECGPAYSRIPDLFRARTCGRRRTAGTSRRVWRDKR
jgi:hypothetical protein